MSGARALGFSGTKNSTGGNQSENCGEGIKFNLRDNIKQIHFQNYMIIGTDIYI